MINFVSDSGGRETLTAHKTSTQSINH